MAPEQWLRPAAPSTDVYAATATFFECLTGAKPYSGTTLIELAVQHTEAEIPAEQAPEALRPLILAGLAKTPEQRPDGAALLIEQLEAVAGAAYGPDWEARGGTGSPRWSPCCPGCCRTAARRRWAVRRSRPPRWGRRRAVRRGSGGGPSC
ncbi:hypothetical protein ACFQ0T_02485 [Kitasatospora gansuensis]